MKVYVVNKHGEPLMPCSPGKARILLKQGKAVPINNCPFTIKLRYGSSGYRQKITVKVDAGSKGIGLSAVCPETKEELYSGEVIPRNDIVKLLSIRQENRRTRRNRKTRYREPRFDNRVKSKQKGWLAPSVRNKIDIHVTAVRMIGKLLPIYDIIVETASFDIQKIKNPDISGEEYQQGEQAGFWNTREYVLFRDGHVCQCCKGKSKDKILEVHHIESRETGGDSPGNLVTLCKTCHDGHHAGTVVLPESIKRTKSFHDSTFMGIMRKSVLKELRNIYEEDRVRNTYGWITKTCRINAGLPKEHRVDALCLEQPNVKDYKRLNVWYLQKKTRCHNRQIHKMTIGKGGKRKSNQAPFEVEGFRLFDKVLYNGTVCFISGRRQSGYFKLVTLDGTVVHNSAKAKNIRLLEHTGSWLTEQKVNNI